MCASSALSEQPSLRLSATPTHANKHVRFCSHTYTDMPTEEIYLPLGRERGRQSFERVWIKSRGRTERADCCRHGCLAQNWVSSRNTTCRFGLNDSIIQTTLRSSTFFHGYCHTVTYLINKNHVSSISCDSFGKCISTYISAKLQMCTYKDNSLLFPAELNTSGNKTPTFIAFHVNYDYRCRFYAVPYSILFYELFCLSAIFVNYYILAFASRNQFHMAFVVQ